MMAVAVLTLITVGFYPVLRLASSGSIAFQADGQLKAGSQLALLKISSNLTQSKRIFQNNANDLAFLRNGAAYKIDLGGVPGADLVGSTLPVIESEKYPTTVPPASAGNCLFFASLSSSPEMEVMDGTLPTPVALTLRVDAYRFHFYYVGEGQMGKIGNQINRMLYEWESADYVDWAQISAIQDATIKTNVLKALAGLGRVYAWDPSQTNANAAFYKYDDQGVVTAQGSHTILRNSGGPMVKVVGSAKGPGYAYGVSPNTTLTQGGANDYFTKHPVPKFASRNALAPQFPSGFEALVSGYPAARQVFLRLVLAADTGYKHDIACEQSQLSSVRDVW